MGSGELFELEMFGDGVERRYRKMRPEVEALTGQRRVPVLVMDGEAICDSRRIVEYLDHRRATAGGRRPI